MAATNDDALARRFFLSGTATAGLGTVVGWAAYDVSGAVLGAIVGGLLGIVVVAALALRS